MREVIEIYGKTIFHIVIMAVLLGLIFIKMTDVEGNRGIHAIISNHMESYVECPADVTAFCSEAEKNPPYFTSMVSGYLKPGKYQTNDIIKAWDYEGKELEVHIIQVFSMDGKELEKELNFSQPGIYEIKAAAVDRENRMRYCSVKIPITAMKV